MATTVPAWEAQLEDGRWTRYPDDAQRLLEAGHADPSTATADVMGRYTVSFERGHFQTNPETGKDRPVRRREVET